MFALLHPTLFRVIVADLSVPSEARLNLQARSLFLDDELLFQVPTLPEKEKKQNFFVVGNFVFVFVFVF